MSPLSSLLLALVVLLSLSLYVPVADAQSLYSLCYTLSSSLSSSPVFPWSVTVSGTLNVSAPLAGSGGQVVVQSATLQRTAVYHGRTYSTAGLTNSLAPAGSYQSNDNTLSLTAPYLTDPHSLAFVFATGVYSAYGNSSGSYVALYNDSTYGLAEDNIPPSDGVLADVQATFTLTPSTTYTASVACSQPASPSLTPAQLVAVNTPVVYAFCYNFAGGPGDGTVGGTWSINVQGNLTTSQYTGTGSYGGTGSVVTAIQGVRTYTDPTGVTTSSRIVGLASSNWQHGLYASNVLYSAYPYFDTEGLFYVGDSPLLGIEVPASSPTITIGQLIVDSYNMFDETTYDTASYAAYLSSVGAIDITPAVGGNLSTLQCSSTAGSAVNYAFCYTLNSDRYHTALPYSIVVYGVVSATGPVLRQGLPALTMQSMTGVRSLTMNGVTTSQNIVRLVYINGDNDLTQAAILNDNLLYLNSGYQAAPIDYFGFVYSLSSNAVFPTQTSPTTDINLSTGGGTWYEWPVLGGHGANTTVASLNFTAATNPTTFPCQANTATPVVVPPSTSMQFCYTAQTTQYSILAQGSMMLYGATITVGQRSALALQSASGTRTYYGADGTVNTVAITGVSADSFGAVNYTTYNQLLYTAAPYVDTAGILFTLATNQLALTPAGPISGDPVVNLMALSNGSVVEQAVENSVGAANRTVIVLTLGAAASSCSVNTFGAGGGGSSSSGLSHGAIAGIVIGSVVGAVLLAALAVLACGCASCASKPANTSGAPASPQPTGTYDNQRDASSKATGVELA